MAVQLSHAHLKFYRLAKMLCNPQRQNYRLQFNQIHYDADPTELSVYEKVQTD